MLPLQKARWGPNTPYHALNPIFAVEMAGGIDVSEGGGMSPVLAHTSIGNEDMLVDSIP